MTRRASSAFAWVLLLAGGIAPTAAAWTPPVDLSASDGDASEPQVAVDAPTNALVVWRRDGLIEARARSWAGTLGPIQTISKLNGTSSHPRLAMDRNGNVFIVWEFDKGPVTVIHARYRSPSGALWPDQEPDLDRSQ